MAKIQKFLEANTSIIVQKGSESPVRMKLNSELILNSLEDTINPLDPSEPALSSQVGSSTVYFPPFKLRSRFMLEEGDLANSGILNEQLAQIDYDIPSTGPSAGYSPVARLYSVAVPLTESVWLVRAGDIPYTLIGEMLDKGCKVEYTLLDTSETKKKVARAIGFLQAKIESAIASANEAMERAETALKQAEEQPDSEELKKAAEKYVKRSKEVVARLKKLEKEMVTGTTRFGLASAAFGPANLLSHARQIRENAAERAKAYQEGKDTLAASDSSTARELAKSASEDKLPVFVMSDALTDIGADEQAQGLNDVFNLS